MNRRNVIFLLNIIALVIYIWSYIKLLRGGHALLLCSPWFLTGIFAQVASIAALIQYIREQPEPYPKQELKIASRLLWQLSYIFMWLQLNVAFALVVTANWRLSQLTPNSLYILWIVISLLPIIFYGFKLSWLARRTTQVAVLVTIYGQLYMSFKTKNYDGMEFAFLMFCHLIFVSLPRVWPFVQEVTLLLPCVVCFLLVRELRTSALQGVWILSKEEQAVQQENGEGFRMGWMWGQK